MWREEFDEEPQGGRDESEDKPRGEQRGHGEDGRKSRPPRNYGPMPSLFSIHRGKVVRVEKFGAFVEMDGYKRHGLVHISQLSSTPVESVEDVVSLGEKIWVKVISVTDDEAKKISLSMKFVSQSDGKDMDANNVQLSKTADRSRPTPVEAKKIQLGAVLDTVCTRCGGKGHLAFECYAQGSSYELLEIPPEDRIKPKEAPPVNVAPVGGINSMAQAQKILLKATKKKEKEEKKRKRKEERKAKRGRKKAKKELKAKQQEQKKAKRKDRDKDPKHKKRKKHHGTSSSDSEADSGSSSESDSSSSSSTSD